MGQERRKYPRVTVPIDGQWRNASTGSFCRVLNVSLGGCFVKSPSAPSSTDMSTMTMYFTRHGDMLTMLEVIEDPVYLTEPFLVSRNWVLESNANMTRVPAP